ncbi:adenylate/guanylate cyclase domain-containing protein, partial [Chitinimonas sp.]|uniref:adenylate/guanylate cyclase domain-containing protein n=1 Tax=Chitinimonas sp. TaxID=1934313 RepID=UPI002F926EEE
PASVPAEDDALAASIARNGPVVLAANIEYRETAAARQWMRVDPLPRLQRAGALPGLASVELDRDGVLRRFPQSPQALWRQVLLQLERQQPGVAAQRQALPGQRIRYLSAEPPFTRISYYRLLEPDRYLAPGWREQLRDNVVLVGRSGKAATEIGAAQSDLFLTPFFGRSGEMTPGVEIHANLIANMVEGQTLQPLAAAWVWWLLLGQALLISLVLPQWRPLLSGLMVGGLMLAVGGLAFVLFRTGWWLAVGQAMLAPLLAYVAQGGQAYFQEQARKREIRRAFEHYVSPAVVEQIVANPMLLRLGGERCELTVLFTDLAGFTQIAETMPSEAVAELLNRHLADMTEIVIRHGGTVDKFIGDSVMAFWGAPIADPRQAEHALAAALDMQAAMQALHDDVLLLGGPELRIRIGLHRGECVVGNLGGEKRFSYTAVGDSVNLASRLEGVNKVYGTTILLSGEVAAALDLPEVRLRQVDIVRVVGKTQAIAIYTPCADPHLRAMTEVAFRVYLRGEVEPALLAWRTLQTQYLADTVADVFLARLTRWRDEGLPAGWDGVSNLQSK